MKNLYLKYISWFSFLKTKRGFLRIPGNSRDSSSLTFEESLEYEKAINGVMTEKKQENDS